MKRNYLIGKSCKAVMNEMRDIYGLLVRPVDKNTMLVVTTCASDEDLLDMWLKCHSSYIKF